MKPGKNKEHFEDLLKQAQVMVKEMKYQSAISILRNLVVLPISAILKEDNAPYSTKKLFGGIFCEAFATLTELSCQFEYCKELDEEIVFLMQQPQVGDLFLNKNTDVIFKLRFAAACADMAESSFARNTPKCLVLNLSAFDAAKDVFRNMGALNKEYGICFVKILTVQGITSFLRRNFDDRKILEDDQVVPLEAVWKHWKEVGFPDQHLLLIICVGCLVMENSRKRNVCLPVGFLDEFTRLTARAFKLRMYLVAAIIPYSEVVYHYKKSSKLGEFFKPIVEAIAASWDLEKCKLKEVNILAPLVLQIFVDASTDNSVKDSTAIELYHRCFQILEQLGRTSDAYVELEHHMMSVCNHWMEVKWKNDLIELAEDTTERLLLESAVTWMYDGNLSKEDENEATKCFEKAEECFNKYSPSGYYKAMLYHLKLALFLKLRGRTDEAIENLLICKTYLNNPVYLSNLDLHFFPQELKDIINNFKQREGRNGVTIPSHAIIGSLLVTHYVTLGRSDDAKREALKLLDKVRRSFNFYLIFTDVLRMGDTSPVVAISSHQNEDDDDAINQFDHVLGLRQYQGRPTDLPPLVSSVDCVRSIMPVDCIDHFIRLSDLLKFCMDDMVKHGDEILKKSKMTSGESTMLDLIRHFVNAKSATPRSEKALYYLIARHALKQAGLEEMALAAFARSALLEIVDTR